MDTNIQIGNLNPKMTISELLAMISICEQPRTLHSISELAEYLGCSRATAQRLKSSGKIDKAVTQYGRSMRIDVGAMERILKGGH